MDLEVELFRRMKDSALDKEGALKRCQLARKLEDAGDYEAARDALGELWRGPGQRPQIEGLDRLTAAEVLLRAGVLTGWLGHARQLEGAQETAKNLISESQLIFESLRERQKSAEALTELAYCYWREGAFDEARVALNSALDELDEKDSQQRALALLRLAVVERTAARFDEALRILNQAAPLFAASDSPALKGKFHQEMATALEELGGAAEQRQDYTKRALAEYAAASFHFGRAGHKRYRGCVEVKLAMLCFAQGKFREAHEHLDCARPLFAGLKESGYIARLDEARARVLLAEGRVAEAEKVARESVRLLDKGDERSLLAEALTTHGTALARLGRYEQALQALQRAMDRAQRAGDPEGAGRAALTLIEELAERFIPSELAAIYERAADLLAPSQHPALLARLCAAARRVISVITASNAPVLAPAAQNAKEFRQSLTEMWEGYSLQAEVHRYEQRMIALALKTAGGAVTRAAALLGIEHHQTLIAMLNTRHRNLLSERKQVIPRHRSIVRNERSARRAQSRETQPVRVLLVEDNRLLLRTMMETLAIEGWHVEVCEDGAQALAKIEGAEAFDLFLLDSNLPGLSGIELTRRARQLSHRRQTPIIIFSASRVEMTARRAGANAFLRKPDDVNVVAKTIKDLLAARQNK